MSTLEERLRFALQSVPAQHDGVDMSAAAITSRLRDACEMSSLCLALAAAQDRAHERAR